MRPLSSYRDGYATKYTAFTFKWYETKTVNLITNSTQIRTLIIYINNAL